MKSALFLLAFLAGFSGCSAQAESTGPREPLVLGVVNNARTIPVFIALEKGFYRDEGLDLTLKPWPVGKLAFEAMLRGEVEVATVAETPIVLQSFKRQDYVVIASFCYGGAPRLLTDRKTGIHTVADLRGHRVGATAGTTPQFVLHSALADIGMAPSEIVEVNISAPDIADALVNGRVDAIIAVDPYGIRAEKALGEQAQLIPYDKGRHVEIFNFATRRDYPKTHPIAAQRLLRATQRAILWIHDHRQETITLAASWLKIDEADLETLWRDYRYALSLDQLLIATLEGEARWAIREGLVEGKEMPDYLDTLDTSALDKVLPAAVSVIK